MADDPKVKFDNKREMDAAAFSQAAYVLDQARQNLGELDACEKALNYNQLLWSIIQSDVAEWDAGDIRYNVLRWTSSPRPPFGGYGPSFVNPRAGQILGADVMLEFVYFTNRVKYDKLYDDVYEKQNWTEHCFAGEYLYQANQFGFTSATISSYSEEVKKRIVNESLIRLVLHEVGHTLGLNHNF